MKYVRVDERTVIEVDARKPNEIAIKEYLEKISHTRPKYLSKDFRANAFPPSKIDEDD